MDLSESLKSQQSSEYSNIEFDNFNPFRASNFLIVELKKRLKKLLPGSFE